MKICLIPTGNTSDECDFQLLCVRWEGVFFPDPNQTSSLSRNKPLEAYHDEDDDNLWCIKTVRHKMPFRTLVQNEIGGNMQLHLQDLPEDLIIQDYLITFPILPRKMFAGLSWKNYGKRRALSGCFFFQGRTVKLAGCILSLCLSLSYFQRNMTSASITTLNLHCTLPVVLSTFLHHMARWWFQISFIFTPILGEMIQFDELVYFSGGWLNHQLDDIILKLPYFVRQTSTSVRHFKLGNSFCCSFWLRWLNLGLKWHSFLGINSKTENSCLHSLPNWHCFWKLVVWTMIRAPFWGPTWWLFLSTFWLQFRSPKKGQEHTKNICGQVFFWNMEERKACIFSSQGVQTKKKHGFFGVQLFFWCPFSQEKLEIEHSSIIRDFSERTTPLPVWVEEKTKGPKKSISLSWWRLEPLLFREQKPMSRDWPTGGEGLSFVVLHLAEFTWGHMRGLHGWWWWWWWWWW